MKWHYFDKKALVDIFNHTRSGFSHKNGIFAGHVINTGQPVLYDVYDSSHTLISVIKSVPLILTHGELAENIPSWQKLLVG